METFRTLFPPKPTLTEKNLGDQAGKVFLITGASAGIGEALANILYQHNATIYVAARSRERAEKAMAKIQAAHPESQGALVFLHLDLSDLTTIRATAEAFLAAERRLDVLWLNAGVMVPPAGSRTAQGYELQLGTNNVAHFLLVRYLHPALREAAKGAPRASVRVVWVSSSAADSLAPKPPIDFDNMDYHKKEGPWTMYGRSKAGNVLHGVEFARRVEDEGIVSVSLNPGNLKSDLQRHLPRVLKWFMERTILYEARYGAYTELFAGLSPEVGQAQNGAWLQPWGRVVQGRKDLWDPDLGAKYWTWSEQQVKDY